MKTQTHERMEQYNNSMISPVSSIDFADEPEMSEGKGELGLCENCMHLKNCMYCKRAMGAIWHCELHEENTVEVSFLQTQNANKTEIKQYQGLCANCDHRESCCLPAKKTGALHCEEYC